MTPPNHSEFPISSSSQQGHAATAAAAAVEEEEIVMHASDSVSESTMTVAAATTSTENDKKKKKKKKRQRKDDEKSQQLIVLLEKEIAMSQGLVNSFDLEKHIPLPGNVLGRAHDQNCFHEFETRKKELIRESLKLYADKCLLIADVVSSMLDA